MKPKEIQLALSQLILLNGMVTDPNVPGTEKITCATLRPEWLATPALKVSATDVGANETWAPPGSIFLVKGWNRCCCCLGVLYAMYQLPELLEATFLLK